MADGYFKNSTVI